MHSTHLKGLIGEYEFTTYLLKKGYSILKPINPNSSYDLVIEKNNKFQKLQIKYLTPTNKGILRVELERPKRKADLYKRRGVDAMGIFDSMNHKFYLIPIKNLKHKSEIWIRVGKMKKIQKKNINFASKYSL